jgi:hypothetical protein
VKIRTGFSIVVVAAVVALLAVVSPAGATSSTPLDPTTYGATDGRHDFPSRPGTMARWRYGSYHVEGGSPYGQIHNQIVTVPAPCTNCRITDMVPDLVDASTGQSVNIGDGLMLHHFALVNPGATDAVCPTQGQGQLGQRFFASGNERTHMHLPQVPQAYGYTNDNATWTLIIHIVNFNATLRSVDIQVDYRWRPKSETVPATPAWLDIDGCGNPFANPPGGDSEYSIPGVTPPSPINTTDYHDADDTHPFSADWQIPNTAPWNTGSRLIAMGGHSHDVDVTGPGACAPDPHCPEKGGGVAVTAELRSNNAINTGTSGRIAGPYYGPNPPGPVPSDLPTTTTTTLCRSKTNYGTAWAKTQDADPDPLNPGPWDGHLDTMNLCGIFSSLPPGAQSEAYPASAAYPYQGVTVTPGQWIRVHSQYQNDTGFQQNDVMGIFMAWFATGVGAPNTANFPRPGGGSPLRVPLVPEFNKCISSNSQHVPPLSQPSCTPPVETSSVLTTSATGKQSGSARYDAVPGNTATNADEADVKVVASVTDVKKRSDGTDYVGPVLLTSKLRVTDKSNGVAGEPATVQDAEFQVPVNCISTIDNTIGSTCSVNTTADALVPGYILETRRTIFALESVTMKDAGPNGTGYGAGCPQTCGDGDEAVFLRQGVFTP